MKLFNYKYSKSTIDFGLLLMRLVFGGIMIPEHGLKKLMNFSTLSNNFVSFLGLSSSISLSLAIFAELFCALFIVLGLMTRWATIPLIITMLMALNFHNWAIIGEAEYPFVLGMAYLIIALLGPGKYSFDYLINKKK